MREMLRGGGMVGLWVPRARVCRRAGSGVDANANPGTWIACNRSARCNRGAKTWPYRPKGNAGPESRDCIPGWWTWPYRPESQGAALGASRDLRRHVFVNLECHGAKRGAAFAFWGLVRGRRSRIRGLHAFAGPLRFRPVGPVPSAWHEMPGYASRPLPFDKPAKRHINTQFSSMYLSLWWSKSSVGQGKVVQRRWRGVNYRECTQHHWWLTFNGAPPAPRSGF